jgi:hypothetical protein
MAKSSVNTVVAVTEDRITRKRRKKPVFMVKTKKAGKTIADSEIPKQGKITSFKYSQIKNSLM